MPVTPTYDLIASNVLSSSASSVTFSSIPATYRDLVLVVDGLSTTGNGSVFLRVNSDTGSNYNRVSAYGDGSTVASDSATSLTSIDTYGGVSSTVRGITRIQILDYSATDKHKAILIRGDRSNSAATMSAARWASTSAINAIEIYSTLNPYASGSTFYLYGIVS